MGIAEVPARVLVGQLNLAGAWERVQSKAGMPGADGISVSRFRRMAGPLLRGLEGEMAREEYRPHPLRVAEVRKKNGGVRLLLIPGVADRVAQSAASGWLAARWNPGFDEASFAYRKGTGVHDALRALMALRDRGMNWVLDADIRSFFDSISHSQLLSKLGEWLGTASPMYRWLERWVRAPIWDGRAVSMLTRGVPQGSPLSPILANYYLDGFDRKLRAAGVEFVRYADDFLVTARTPFELAEQRRVVEDGLRELELELSDEKTRVTTFEKVFRFLGAEVRQDAVLLPFDKKKTKNGPAYVAPAMPKALLRAWHGGHLKAREWVWEPHTPPETGIAERPEHPVLKKLAGSPSLDKLRRRP